MNGRIGLHKCPFWGPKTSFPLHLQNDNDGYDMPEVPHSGNTGSLGLRPEHTRVLSAARIKLAVFYYERVH